MVSLIDCIEPSYYYYIIEARENIKEPRERRSTIQTESLKREIVSIREGYRTCVRNYINLLEILREF